MILSYCHNSSTVAAPNLLNRSSSKSLLALYFSNQAAAPPPWAGPCVRGSPWQPVSARRVRWYLGLHARLRCCRARSSNQSWCRGCCVRVVVKEVYEVIHVHQLMYSSSTMSGICQKPMSAIRNNMSCLLEVNWVWNLKLTANRAGRSAPCLIDSAMNK